MQGCVHVCGAVFCACCRLLVSYIPLALHGRSKKKLRQLLPSIDCFSYKELFSKKLSFDYIIHLAVANNDQELDEKAFYITNVKLLSDLLSFAKRSKVTKFFNNSLFIERACSSSFKKK